MLNNTSSTSSTSQNLDRNLYRQDGPDEAVVIGRYVAGNVVALNPPKTTRAAFKAAVAYAMFRGWKVFPADTEAKKSYLSAAYAPGGMPWGMTADYEQLRQNFLNRKWRDICGVGVPTGAVNGIFDIEADTIKGHGVDGLASLRKLEAKHGKLPDTLMAMSPSGSVHRIYRHPGRGFKIKSSDSELAPGVDIKGDGGMFIAPPSIRSDGAYKWLNDLPVAEAPAWLIELLRGEAADNNGHNDPLENLYEPLSEAEKTYGCIAIRDHLPNKDDHWNIWNTKGMKIWEAVPDERGREAFHGYSKRLISAERKYSKKRTDEKWKAYPGSPPTDITDGSFIYLVNEAIGKGWRDRIADEEAAQQQAPEMEGVTRADFRAYLPEHSYIFTPTGTFWSMAGVKACLQSNTVAKWLDRNQPVHHLTWVPGRPMLIEGQLVIDGEWVARDGVTTFNLYRPPTLKHGDASKAGPWLELVHKVYPKDGDRLITYLAHCVQRPQEKINCAAVLGGAPGIGKDTIVEPAKRGVGAWNCREVSPGQILGRFNGFLQSVILRVSEVRDLGEFNRYQFYERMKAMLATPPNTMRVDEKNKPEHEVENCLFAILTTNHLTDGIYLPADDRRHDVMWSELTKDDFEEGYWDRIWGFYNQDGGDGHVVAYLASLDISTFNPKAPPPKTPAFWAIVEANRAPEEGELADILDKLGNPDAVTLDEVIEAAGGIHTGPYSDRGNIANWLGERKNRRIIPHRFEAAGYVPVRNDARDIGLWVINDKRQVVYAKKSFSLRERLQAVTALQRKYVEEKRREAAEKAAQEAEREAKRAEEAKEWERHKVEWAAQDAKKAARDAEKAAVKAVREERHKIAQKEYDKIMHKARKAAGEKYRKVLDAQHEAWKAAQGQAAKKTARGKRAKAKRKSRKRSSSRH